MVGEFNASDPDGESLAFSLVSGAGDQNNQDFFLPVMVYLGLQGGLILRNFKA